MRGFHFEPTTSTSDWRQPFYIFANGEYLEWHPPDDEIILGISPDERVWEDYGSRSVHYPPGRAQAVAPYFSTSSNDGNGYVTLISPGLIDVIIPASIMRGLGPGQLNVGMRFARASDNRTATVFIGRLPVVSGIV